MGAHDVCSVCLLTLPVYLYRSTCLLRFAFLLRYLGSEKDNHNVNYISMWQLVHFKSSIHESLTTGLKDPHLRVLHNLDKII